MPFWRRKTHQERAQAEERRTEIEWAKMVAAHQAKQAKRDKKARNLRHDLELQDTRDRLQGLNAVIATERAAREQARQRYRNLIAFIREVAALSQGTAFDGVLEAWERINPMPRVIAAIPTILAGDFPVCEEDLFDEPQRRRGQHPQVARSHASVEALQAAILQHMAAGGRPIDFAKLEALVRKEQEAARIIRYSDFRSMLRYLNAGRGPQSQSPGWSAYHYSSDEDVGPDEIHALVESARPQQARAPGGQMPRNAPILPSAQTAQGEPSFEELRSMIRLQKAAAGKNHQKRFDDLAALVRHEEEAGARVGFADFHAMINYIQGRGRVGLIRSLSWNRCFDSSDQDSDVEDVLRPRRPTANAASAGPGSPAQKITLPDPVSNRNPPPVQAAVARVPYNPVNVSIYDPSPSDSDDGVQPLARPLANAGQGSQTKLPQVVSQGGAFIEMPRPVQSNAPTPSNIHFNSRGYGAHQEPGGGSGHPPKPGNYVPDPENLRNPHFVKRAIVTSPFALGNRPPPNPASDRLRTAASVLPPVPTPPQENFGHAWPQAPVTSPVIPGGMSVRSSNPPNASGPNIGQSGSTRVQSPLTNVEGGMRDASKKDLNKSVTCEYWARMISNAAPVTQTNQTMHRRSSSPH